MKSNQNLVLCEDNWLMMKMKIRKFTRILIVKIIYLNKALLVTILQRTLQ